MSPQSTVLNLGTGHSTETDEFLEKFQMAVDSPPHFRKIMLQFFSESPILKVQNLQHIFFEFASLALRANKST